MIIVPFTMTCAVFKRAPVVPSIQVAAMPGREKARFWVVYARTFAQCLVEMEGNADHPAAHRLVMPMRLQGCRCCPSPFAAAHHNE